QISQNVFTNGAIMSLVLGVGGRLIKKILGWQQVQQQNPASQRPPLSVWIAVLLFVLSYILEPMLQPLICWIARLLVTLFFAFKYWMIWRPPATRSLL